MCTRFSLVPLRFTHKPLLCVPTIPWYANIKMASDGTRWSKDEINALIDAYSDVKMSADPMTTNRELYSSIKSLLELNNDVQRSTKQIETKVIMKKLKSGYSKLKDRMKVSGAERPYDSKSLSSVEKVAFQHWDNLDRILGGLIYYIIAKIIMQ